MAGVETDREGNAEDGRDGNAGSDRDASAGTDWDPEAIAVGGAANIAIAVLAATVALPEALRWPAFAAVAAGGLLGGYLAGRLAAGSWQRQLHHGLAAGLLGGAALSIAVWWSLQPGTPAGALWPANYALAVAAGWLPSELAARYDVAIGVAAALALGGAYVAEGVLAGGAAPGGDADAMARR